MHIGLLLIIVKPMEEAAEEGEHKGWRDQELATDNQTRSDKTQAVKTLHAEIDELEATIAQLTEKVAKLAQAIADSGQLSKSASVRAQNLAEALELAPAACLDYFDAIYLREDLDGEHAGFSPSGHLLRNESILNELDAEYDHLPLQLTRPLAPIQVHPGGAQARAQ